MYSRQENTVLCVVKTEIRVWKLFATSPMSSHFPKDSIYYIYNRKKGIFLHQRFLFKFQMNYYFQNMLPAPFRQELPSLYINKQTASKMNAF